VPFFKKRSAIEETAAAIENASSENALTNEELTLSGATPPPPHAMDRSVAVLVTLSGDQVGRKYAIRQEATIGRTPECAVCLYDPRVSRRHAILKPLEGGGFQLHDLGSSNGTLINGERVHEQELHPGDRVQVGNHTLMFMHRDPLQDQLLQRQKLEAIGRLGAGVAHDFNNLLGAAMATIEYLGVLPQDRPLGDAEVVDCLRDIRIATVRATELTHRLLAFSRLGQAEHSGVDVTALCSDVFQLLRRTVDQSIDLRQQVLPKLAISGHGGELHQVLMNLCINARDAMPEGGVLTISAEMATEAALEAVPLASAYAHVLITVTDTGVGMDETTQQLVFEPFFTTKPAGVGAGLGLATVYEVVTGHGGAVTVDSEPGRGTTVRLYLPAAEAGPSTSRHLSSTARQRALRAAATGPGVGVLIVDDEQLVRRSLERVLRVAGHRVEQARDGAEALEFFEEGRQQPDVVLLDLDMPRLDGVATLQGIRALSPDAAVVCVSGCVDEVREKKLRALGVQGVLEKPCAAAELLDAVTNAVASRETPTPSRQ